MNVRFYRIVLRRKSESVESEREKDVIALHPSLTRDNLETRVRFYVTDVHSRAARVREFHESVKLAFRFIVARAKRACVFPSFLPLGFYRFKIVIHIETPLFHCRRRVSPSAATFFTLLRETPRR